MTVKWASLGAVIAAYIVLGSMQEDDRLNIATGAPYRCYRSRVLSLFLPPVDHYYEVRGGRIRRRPAYETVEWEADQA